MSFLTQNLLRTVRQTALISNLAYSFRALSLTTNQLQRKTAVQPQQVCNNLKSLQQQQHQQAERSTPKEDESKCQEVFAKVNQQLAAGEEGRLFAVVHLCGKQFKVTAGDIILVEGYWPPTIGDEIRLEKVLLAGAKDFTLIGRPILDVGLVNIKATIIEKTLTHTKTHFKKKRRKQYLRINFQRSPNTMIRINTIEIVKKVDSTPNVINENRIF